MKTRNRKGQFTARANRPEVKARVDLAWKDFQAKRAARERAERKRQKKKAAAIAAKRYRPQFPAARAPDTRLREQRYEAKVEELGVEGARQERASRMRDLARHVICEEYRRDRKARREAMFATGGAGKGRRNTGPRMKDWRAEYCK